MVTLTYQERFKTSKGVFDEHTERDLFELQSRQVLDEVVSPLKIGKESHVFIANKGKKKLIVKIYRVQNCDFKRMYNYIKKDPRFSYLQHHRRQIIYAWAQREFRNLKHAEKAKVYAPSPIAFKNNIIVEEMIGAVNPAPVLKDKLPQHPEFFFDQIIVQVRKLYQQGLVHGDLSAFNILIYKERPYLIDFSQATLTETPNSEELLERDVRNIINFFLKLGVRRNLSETIKKIIS